MNTVAGLLDPVLPRDTRAILLLDVVESVRLVEEDESGFVACWLAFMRAVSDEVLPRHGGRLVKGLGDGMLIDFENSRSAVAAAFAVQRLIQVQNSGRPEDRRIHLRIGIETGEVIVTPSDVYGRSVNRAARLATLAGPHGICISAAVRDQLTADLDADLEDLGDCYVKHLDQPIRTYRVAPPHEPGPTGPPPSDLLPAIAIIPFSAREAGDPHVLGEILAEELIRDFSQAADFNVISRLSTTNFRGRTATLEQIATALRAEFVIWGYYSVKARQITVEAELVDVKTGQIAWAGEIKGNLNGLLSGRRELIGEIVTAMRLAITSREIGRVRSQRLSSLRSYTLMIAATALMHRLSPADFADARTLLEALIERTPRQALPQALLANWHVLRVQQGWSQDVAADARTAQQWTRQAIEIDPHCSLALTVDGFVHANLLKQLDEADNCYARALQSNPSDGLSWLLRGTLHAFKGEGHEAVRCSRRALALSPLDPHRYFYDSLAATAYLSAHQFERALACAKRSLRLNRTHTSTLRALAVAHWNLGDAEAARKAAAELLVLDPQWTIKSWIERSPSAGYAIGREWIETFKAIGLPN